MPAPLSADLRRRVLAAARSASAPHVAARFGVSVATVHRLRALDRLHGSTQPKPHAGGKARLIIDDDRPFFDACLAENPSMPHEQMARRFAEATGRVVSRSTVRRALARWRLTRKKKSLIAQQRYRPDVVARREAFLAEVAEIPAERLVFVDESGCAVGMRSAYGFAPVGERCVEAVPFRVGRRVNLIGWLRASGGSVRPLEGSVKAAEFEAFVAESLVPGLKAGDVVVWDNARIHSPKAIALVAAVGARVLAQPPYSPDLNAIEMLWSKVKAAVRQRLADTGEALLAALYEAVPEVTCSDAEGWIRHCGYTFQPE